jgi:hypothetical protein
MEVLMLASWNIWLIQNGKNFRQEGPTFGRWKAKFIHDISLLQYRIKTKHREGLLAWIRAALESYLSFCR